MCERGAAHLVKAAAPCVVGMGEGWGGGTQPGETGHSASGSAPAASGIVGLAQTVIKGPRLLFLNTNSCGSAFIWLFLGLGFVAPLGSSLSLYGQELGAKPSHPHVALRQVRGCRWRCQGDPFVPCTTKLSVALAALGLRADGLGTAALAQKINSVLGGSLPLLIRRLVFVFTSHKSPKVALTTAGGGWMTFVCRHALRGEHLFGFYLCFSLMQWT